ncbi:MAG: DUF5916 domain-containing protein [Gemmatimonadaceae bacterium]
MPDAILEDADYLQVDSSAGSLSGYSAKLGFNKSGDWSFSATAKAVNPGFEVNDLGFMGRVDYRNLGWGGSYNNSTPGKLLRGYNLFVGTNHAWNYGGDKIWTSFFNQVTLNFNNLWTVYGVGEYDPSAIDDRLTRGGPRGRQPTQYGLWTQINTDTRKSVSYNLYTDYYGDERKGYQRDLTFGVDIRATSSVHITVSPNLSLYHNTIQYVQVAADPPATETYGSRVVFGHIHQATLSATTRAEWTLTPLLSFQMYAQPFASAGRFNGFKELATPGTQHYLVYGTDNSSTITTVKDPVTNKTMSYTVDPDGPGAAAPFSIGNPDFRTHSLRGNAVIRWEYRPGSALFFVWQQERSDFLPLEGDFRTGRDTREIFGRPSNLFLVKATYWFAR